MHKQWPFFRTRLSNLDMVLAQTVCGIHITINGLAAGLRNTGSVWVGCRRRRAMNGRDRPEAGMQLPRLRPAKQSLTRARPHWIGVAASSSARPTHELQRPYQRVQGAVAGDSRFNRSIARVGRPTAVSSLQVLLLEWSSAATTRER
jgi:hypothetical protein